MPKTGFIIALGKYEIEKIGHWGEIFLYMPKNKAGFMAELKDGPAEQAMLIE